MNPSNNNFGGPGDSRGRAILGKPFTLSAAAPEFFPRNYVPPQNGVEMNSGYQAQMAQGQMPMSGQGMSQSAVPQNMGHHMYSGHAQAAPPHHYSSSNRYQPRHGGPNQHRGHGPGHQHPSAAPGIPDPMVQLKQAILILTKDPGTFDEQMPDLTSSLASNIHTEEKLIKMVEEIFRQAVEEANFRYTGARICNYFSHHLSVNFQSGNFRQHLLKRCHEEHKKREDLVKSCDERYKLVGFTLFMGELLLNLTDFTKIAEGSDYMNVIVQAVQELLLTLLSQPAEDTLRCVVQVLKLCGSVLEDGEKAKNEETPTLNSIFKTIKESVLEKSYHKSLRAQMLSVIELRASDWGRDSSHSSQGSAPPPPPPTATGSSSNSATSNAQTANYSNVPGNPAGAFYGDPGQGGDANQFGNFYPDDVYYYSSGEEDWHNPEEYMYMYNGVECIQEDEMDPEIAAAFQEFLDNQPPQQQ